MTEEFYITFPSLPYMFNIPWLFHGKQIDPGQKEVGSVILQQNQ